MSQGDSNPEPARLRSSRLETFSDGGDAVETNDSSDPGRCAVAERRARREPRGGTDPSDTPSLEVTHVRTILGRRRDRCGARRDRADPGPTPFAPAVARTGRRGRGDPDLGTGDEAGLEPVGRVARGGRTQQAPRWCRRPGPSPPAVVVRRHPDGGSWGRAGGRRSRLRTPGRRRRPGQPHRRLAHPAPGLHRRGGRGTATGGWAMVRPRSGCPHDLRVPGYPQGGEEAYGADDVDLAVSPRGAVVVAWAWGSDGREKPWRIQSAYRPPRGPWREPVDVTPASGARAAPGRHRPARDRHGRLRPAALRPPAGAEGAASGPGRRVDEARRRGRRGVRPRPRRSTAQETRWWSSAPTSAPCRRSTGLPTGGGGRPGRSRRRVPRSTTSRSR